MKVLLYGLPRTRSTYLTDVVSRRYNLENYFEPYHYENVKNNNVMLKARNFLENLLP